MHFKTVDNQTVDELTKKLQFLEGKQIKNPKTEEPNYSITPSSGDGKVELHGIPTWYTRIHDVLEEVLVTYSADDIARGEFARFAMNLTNSEFVIQLADSELHGVEVALTVQMFDEETGTFAFPSPVIKRIQEFQDVAMFHATA